MLKHMPEDALATFEKILLYPKEDVALSICRKKNAHIITITPVDQRMQVWQ